MGDGAAVHILEVVVPALGQDQAVALLLQGKKCTVYVPVPGTGVDSANHFCKIRIKWSVQWASTYKTKEVMRERVVGPPPPGNGHTYHVVSLGEKEEEPLKSVKYKEGVPVVSNIFVWVLSPHHQ